MFRLLIFLSLCNLIYGNSRAHNYIPFPMDSTSWRVLVHYYSPITCDEEYILDYSFWGDTLINNINYKKVTSQSLFYRNNRGNYFCSGLGSYYSEVYIRQDSLGKKVYLISYGDTTELLLYDFNLTISDTLKNTRLANSMACNNSCDAIVQSVDSVLIDSFYHLRWNFDVIDPIIEGFGSSANPFDAGWWFHVACIHRNLSTYYGYELAPGDSFAEHNVCSFVVDVPKLENPANNISTTFNNTNKELIIEKGNYTINETIFIRVIDITGRIVLKSSLLFGNLNTLKIKMPNIENGQYIVQITDNKLINNYYRFININ